MIRTVTTLLAVLAASLPTAVAMANGSDDGREAQMKAAYVFNFIKFVDWSAGTRDAKAIQICFSGASHVSAALAAATVGKDVSGRRIEVKPVSNPIDPARCDVLYSDVEIAGMDSEDLASVLTIGASTRFTRNGGVIQLYTESNRLRFVVNVDNAKRAGLQISSHLLKLASRVEQEGSP